MTDASTVSPWAMPIVAFFGAIFLLIGIGVGARGLWRWCRWEHATGKIVDYVAAAASEYDDYYPKIRVSNRPGGTFEFVSAVGGTGKPWPIGAKVKVLYRRDGEKVEGEVVSVFFLWIFPACCLLVGTVMFFGKMQVTN